MKKTKNRPQIVFMSTYPPRECGIATFTEDLRTAFDKKFSKAAKSKILAMNNKKSKNLKYPKDVTFTIDQENLQDYIDVAKKINNRDEIKLVNIQHEFGIFGGYYGENLLKFIETLNKPLIVTFHTVVPHRIHKSDSRKRIIQAIAKKAKHIVVLNKLAINILKKDYGIDDSKIVVIHHGIHDVPFENNIKERIKLGHKDKIVLTTFGFISKHKGYEYVIEALPKVVKKFPNVLYVLAGGTHPTIQKNGESYLDLLKKKTRELGIQKNVKFINKYLTLDEIISHLKAADLYICPTISSGQIVSGTLAYAMGCGRAVVSTPFLHAKDAVTKGRGIVIDGFEKPKLFSDAVIKILSNPSLKEKMEKNTYKYTRQMTWPNVANSYMELFDQYLQVREDKYSSKLVFPTVATPIKVSAAP